MLMYNCYRCSFELTEGDLTTLPESEALDLKSILAPTSLGRCVVRRPGSLAGVCSTPGSGLTIEGTPTSTP